MSKYLLLNEDYFNRRNFMTPNMQRDLALSQFSENIVSAVLASRDGCVRHIDYDKFSRNQRNGIDFYTKNGATDDKMIAGQLPTFSFEVGCHNYTDKYKGWFDPTKANIRTKTITLSYYTVSKEAGGTGKYSEDKNVLVPWHLDKNTGKKVYEVDNVKNIDNLEIIEIDRNKLMEGVKEYFKENGLDFKNQIEKIKETTANSKSWIDILDITGDKKPEKDNKMRFVVSNTIAERPINLVITKEFMEECGAVISRKTYTRPELAACLDIAKQRNQKSDILTREYLNEDEKKTFCSMSFLEMMEKDIQKAEDFEKQYFKSKGLTSKDLNKWYDKQVLTEFDGCFTPDEFVEYNAYTTKGMDENIIPIADYVDKFIEAVERYSDNYTSYEELFEANPEFSESCKYAISAYQEDYGELSDEAKEIFICLENQNEYTRD